MFDYDELKSRDQLTTALTKLSVKIDNCPVAKKN